MPGGIQPEHLSQGAITVLRAEKALAESPFLPVTRETRLTDRALIQISSSEPAD